MWGHSRTNPELIFTSLCLQYHGFYERTDIVIDGDNIYLELHTLRTELQVAKAAALSAQNPVCLNHVAMFIVSYIII